MDVGVEVATGGLLPRAAVGLLPPRAVTTSPRRRLIPRRRPHAVPAPAPHPRAVLALFPIPAMEKIGSREGGGVEQEGLTVGGEREAAIGGEREAGA
jgi:hypothetical protein